jgi:hypothetical protein
LAADGRAGFFVHLTGEGNAFPLFFSRYHAALGSKKLGWARFLLGDKGEEGE